MDRDQALNVAHNPSNPANYHHSVKDEALAVLAEIVERPTGPVNCGCEDAERTYAELDRYCDEIAAENERLRAVIREAQNHRCPSPDWYPNIRDLLGDVSLVAAFTGTDLAELPDHVKRQREIVERAVDCEREYGIGFAGQVAHYILTGEARKGRA